MKRHAPAVIAFQLRWYGSLRSVIPPFAGIHTIRHSRESGNPGVVGVSIGSASRPPDSERYRLLLLAKLTEHVYYYKQMAHRSPCHSDQNHKATEATRCLMPENQKKTPCSRVTKRNPDSNPDSDTTPASDGQIQRPDMSANDREIEISQLTRPPAGRPRHRRSHAHPPPLARRPILQKPHRSPGTPEPGVPQERKDGHCVVAPQPSCPAPNHGSDQSDHLTRNAITSRNIIETYRRRG